MAALNIQGFYGCERCKHAKDIYGRSCDCGDFFPLLLVMGGKNTCPNFETDIEKIEEQLRIKEESRIKEE